MGGRAGAVVARSLPRPSEWDFVIERARIIRGTIAMHRFVRRPPALNWLASGVIRLLSFRRSRARPIGGLADQQIVRRLGF